MNKSILLARKIAATVNSFLIMNLLMFWVCIAMLQIEVKPVYFIFLLWLAVANFVVKEVSASSLVPTIYGLIMSVAVYYTLHIWGVRVMFWTFIIAMVIDDISQMLKGFNKLADVEVRWPGFALTFIMFLFGLNVGSDKLKWVSFVTLVLMLFLFFVEKYLDGLHMYLEQSRSFKGVPLKNVLKTNSIMVAVVVIVLMFGILIGTLLPLNIVIEFVWGIIWKGISYIFSVIFFIGKWISMLFSGGDTKSIEVAVLNGGTPDPLPKGVGDALERFLGLVVTLALTWIFARIALSVAKKLIVKKREDVEHVEISVIKNITKEKVERPKKTKKDRSALGRFRKLYKSIVLENVDAQNLNDADTCKDILGKSNKDLSEVTNLYESVRYGEVDVDGDILDKMRQK